MWIILTTIFFILLCSIPISILILKTIEAQPNWLMNIFASSSTDNETETSQSGVTTAQSESISWQQNILNHVQSMGNSESEPTETGDTPPMPDVQPALTSNKKDKKDKKPTNRFELMDMDES